MIITSCLVGAAALASTSQFKNDRAPQLREPSTLERQVVQHRQISLKFLLNNLPARSEHLGAVAASPTEQYQYHWTRDGALVWQALLKVYQTTSDRSLRQKIRERFQEWVRFEKKCLLSAHQAGLTRGEPKFNLDGSAFLGPWGRPQNDGPALRAIVMSEWAFQLINEGRFDDVATLLYSPTLGDPQSLIKGDLEHSAQTWNVASFDPWEEIKGLNFYNILMQRKALLIGAQLADRMKDPGAARYYREKARDILQFLPQFNDMDKGYIRSVVQQVDGWTHKKASLDSAVILAIIHGPFDLEYMKSNYMMIHATALELERVFQGLYPINQQLKTGIAIGRYPEDVYDGFGFSGGNPWFLTTHAFAEYYCRLAQANPSQAKALRARGLDYLNRVLIHRDQNTGEMSEQFDRRNGYLTGVQHLTWSYASFITAAMACGVGN